jgi:hypothetical protein
MVCYLLGKRQRDKQIDIYIALWFVICCGTDNVINRQMCISFMVCYLLWNRQCDKQTDVYIALWFVMCCGTDNVINRQMCI